MHGPELIVPLILAIEPDRQQAAQLTAIVRSKIGAELVLADSAERALREVGDRIPDLILTPQLLSPRDDAAITNRLRQLGAAAAYVQTLTIPSLATTHPAGAQARARGLLSKLRRQKAAPADAPDGCAPDVFAEQMTVYLDRALEARATQAAAYPPAPVEPRPAAAIEAATAILEQFANPVAEPVNVVMPALPPSEPVACVEAEPAVQQERPAEVPLYIDVAPEAVATPDPFRLKAEATEATPAEDRPSDSLFRPRARTTAHTEPVLQVSARSCARARADAGAGARGRSAARAGARGRSAARAGTGGRSSARAGAGGRRGARRRAGDRRAASPGAGRPGGAAARAGARGGAHARARGR